MKRNKTIQTTLLISRFTFWLLIVLVTAFVLAISYLYVFPESYPDIKILNDGNTSTFQLCTECDFTSNSALLTEIGPGMKLWILLRQSMMGLLVILIIHQVIKILKSVRDYKTFHSQNKLYFKRIAKYALALAIFKTINFIDEGPYGIGLEIGFPLDMLGLALFSLSMSEVFKEGQTLEEDKNAVI